jgi:hypothetical protein
VLDESGRCITAASERLNEPLGVTTHVERNGEIVIRDVGWTIASDFEHKAPRSSFGTPPMTSASQPSRKGSLSWAVMVGCARSRTGRRAYAALMLGSISGICSRDSPNDCLVRDRGVGGSNPLAPTNFPKEICTIWVARVLGYTRVTGASNRTSRARSGAIVRPLLGQTRGLQYRKLLQNRRGSCRETPQRSNFWTGWIAAIRRRSPHV